MPSKELRSSLDAELRIKKLAMPCRNLCSKRCSAHVLFLFYYISGDFLKLVSVHFAARGGEEAHVDHVFMLIGKRSKGSNGGNL